MADGREEAAAKALFEWSFPPEKSPHFTYEGLEGAAREGWGRHAARALAAADRWDHDNGWRRIRIDDLVPALAGELHRRRCGCSGHAPAGVDMAAARSVLAVLRQQPDPDGGQTQPQEQQQ